MIYKNFLKNVNNRKIDLYYLQNLTSTEEIFYPSCFFLDVNRNVVNPINERVMSLGDNINIDVVISNNTDNTDIINEPVFFFVYNTDNYYHFVYDTLPYLISYLELKKEIVNLKLLMNYPNFSKREFYPFICEFLEILEISISDIIIIKPNCLYKEFYYSDSYTHGIDSNLSPREEIYSFYESIVKNIKSKYSFETPKKIYISRRTWIHNDFSNIGTNYTTRRKLINEDELVEELKKYGFVEIFTEKMNLVEKILLFSNAEYIIGPIGGGLCNVLFSNKKCKLISINSPTFMSINSRFKFCFKNVDVKYLDETKHVEENFWKKWMRIKCGDIIGEVSEVYDKYIDVLYTDNTVSGWNSQIEFKKIRLEKKKCTALDNGLNSNWIIDINKIINII